jgi:hypothetical protein
MTIDVCRVFTELWQERRLDTQRVFLYKDKSIHDLRHTASTNLRLAGVDATTAMKIVGHKSERMNRRYNTVEPEDLRWVVLQRGSCHANTVITPDTFASGVETVSPCLSSARP